MEPILMERINKVCQDASVSLKRAASPMTARWTLYHTLPKLAAQTIERAFFPMLVALGMTAHLAVENRKRVVGS